MGIRRPIKPRSSRWLCNNRASHLRVAAVVAIAALLPACSATQMSGLPTSIGGEPGNTPQASATPPAFPAVHDMPPARPVPVMTEAEQKQAEAELVAARDRNINPAAAAAAKKQAQQQQAQKKQKPAVKQAQAKAPPEAKDAPQETQAPPADAKQ
jgi:hypothetical protein